MRTTPCVLAGLVLATAGTVAADVSVTVLVREGDVVGPGTIIELGIPFLNDGSGAVGFTGQLDDGANDDSFVWFSGAALWRNDDALPDNLVGSEATMGLGAAGQFVYSTSINASDGVWTHLGLLARAGEPAPGFPTPYVTTFHDRPTMDADGTCYWVAGLNPTGGPSTQERVLYRSLDGTPATVAKVIESGDSILGNVIAGGLGVGFDYDFSDNGQNHIHDLLFDTGSPSDDGAIYVRTGETQQIVAVEGEDNDDGDNWDNFDLVAINNAGRYVFSGDTDGRFSADEFIAVDGTIAVREGDMVAGVTLTTSSVVRAIAVNNGGDVAHAWADGAGVEYLFVGDGGDLLDSSVLLLQTGDPIDADGDGFADATILDFNASSVAHNNGFFGDDGTAYVYVDLLDDTTFAEFQAILAVSIAGCPGDVTGDGAVDFEDILAVLSEWGACPGCPADLDGSGDVGLSDLLVVLSNFGCRP